MNEQAQDFAPTLIACTLLPRTHTAERHRVDGFEVRRIVAVDDANRAAAIAALAHMAEVVGHVARNPQVIGERAVALELVEHGSERASR